MSVCFDEGVPTGPDELSPTRLWLVEVVECSGWRLIPALHRFLRFDGGRLLCASLVMVVPGTQYMFVVWSWEVAKSEVSSSWGVWTIVVPIKTHDSNSGSSSRSSSSSSIRYKRTEVGVNEHRTKKVRCMILGY